MSNRNLINAKISKNDEFYTLYEDIEEELKHYAKYLENKIIYCNCDNPEISNFWKYFINNFKKLKLKKIICTYISDKESFKTEYDGIKINKIKLEGNGDFRSDECIKILKESDIVVTNPPWSLFIDFFYLLIEYKKDFIVICNKNLFSNKLLFKLIKDDKIKISNNIPKNFRLADNRISDKVSGLARCFTTFFIPKKQFLELNKKYSNKRYCKYDNLDIINIDKTLDIPFDYKGIMGVPITFLDKYNPDQFELIDIRRLKLKGKEKYSRILIRRKEKEEE